MKRSAVLLVPFLLVPFILRAQNICGTPEDRTLIASCDQHATFSSYPPDSTVGPVRVKFHVIRHSDASMDSATGRLLTDSLLSLIGAHVKTAFEDDSVRIALDIIPGCDWIDDDNVYSTMLSQATATIFTVSLPRDTGNTVNVYFGPSMGLSFTAYNPGIPFGSVYIAGDHYYDPAAGYHAVTVIHEMGHVFGLYHTFHQYNQNAENIARTNCYAAGDRLCDTPAHPGVGNGDYLTYNGCAIDTSDGNKDPTSARYADAAPGLRPDTSNYMCYSGVACRNRFSREQAMLMRCSVSNWPEKLPVAVTNRDMAFGTNIGDYLLIGLPTSVFTNG